MKLRALSAAAVVVAGLLTYVFWGGLHTVSGAGQNVIVLCSSCSYEGLPQRGHLVLMDSNTGDVWIYSDAAVEGKEKPVRWGRLTLGQSVVRSAQ